VETQQILRTWNGKTIRQRADGWYSLTDMAAACGKQYHDWARLDNTKEYLAHEETKTGIPVLVAQHGGVDAGTWGNADIAVDFARWLSIPFRSQVNSWTSELLTHGSVNIKETPIADFEALKVVEAFKPVILGTQYASFDHLLSEEAGWRKAMGRERDRIYRQNKSNPANCEAMLADHDREVAAILASRATAAAPHSQSDVGVIIQADKVLFTFSIKALQGLLAPHLVVSGHQVMAIGMKAGVFPPTMTPGLTQAALRKSGFVACNRGGEYWCNYNKSTLHGCFWVRADDKPKVEGRNALVLFLEPLLAAEPQVDCQGEKCWSIHSLHTTFNRLCDCVTVKAAGVTKLLDDAGYARCKSTARSATLYFVVSSGTPRKRAPARKTLPPVNQQPEHLDYARRLVEARTQRSKKELCFTTSTKKAFMRALGSFLDNHRVELMTSEDIIYGAVAPELIAQYGINTWVRSAGRILPYINWVPALTSGGKPQRQKSRLPGCETKIYGLYRFDGGTTNA
jgi:KilA-N domain